MRKYKVTVNGTAYEITVELSDSNEAVSAPAAAAPAAAPVAAPAPAAAPAAQAPAGGSELKSPLPGNILAVNVTNGKSVKKGDVLFILEALKMENEILAPCDGTVASVNVTKGQSVESGALLCVIA